MKRALPLLALLCLLFAAPIVSWADSPATPQAHIPFKNESKSVGNQFGESIMALIIVGGIAVAGLYAMRRYLPNMAALKGGTGKRLQLLETMRLTPKTTVFVIQFDNKTLLLGQHGDSLSVLASNPVTPHAETENTYHV